MNQKSFDSGNDTNNIKSIKSKKEKLNPKHRKILILGMVLIAISVIAVIMLMMPSSIYIYPNSSIKLICEFTEQKNIVLANGEKTKISFGGNCVSTASGIKGDKLVALTSKGELFHITPDKITKIDDDVTEYIISPKASAVMFKTDSGALKLWNENGAVTELADDSGERYAISPNGKCAVYTSSGEKNTEVYLYKDGNTSKIAENIYPLAVSDDCEEIYLYGNETLYISKQGSAPETLAENTQDTFYMNVDCKQIMFCSSQIMYISESGEEPRRVNSGFVDYLLPDGTITVENYDNTTILPQKSLLNGIYYDSMKAAFKLTDKYNSEMKRYETVRYNTQFEQAQISENGNNAYFLKDGNLYIAEAGKEKTNNVIATEVKYFKASEKGNCVYYIDKNGDLYITDESSNKQKISGNVNVMKVLDNGDVLFISKTTLYKSQKGRQAELIDKNVSLLETDKFALYYMSDYNSKNCSGEIYACYIKRNSFTLIEKNAVFAN